MKYRVWDNDAKKYFEPVYRAYAGELSELLLTPSGQVVHRTLDGFSLLDWQRGRWVVEFGVGRVDEAGVGIYQGDIVDVEDLVAGPRDKNQSGRYIVKYNHVSCAFLLEQLDGENAIQFCEVLYYRIVGNKNTNPELLKP